MLKNGRTYYKNLAVWPPQDLKNVSALFNIMHEGVEWIFNRESFTQIFFFADGMIWIDS